MASVEGARAKLFVFSYVSSKRNTATRPVIFAWNGGPGAPSTWLHFGLLGPKRFEFPQPSERPGPIGICENNLSLLDVADIVLLDPVGTGYSEITKGSTESFFDTEADGRATADVIKKYLKATGRAASPVYLIGESYGASRLAVASHFLDDSSRPKVNLAGLVLISQTITNELQDHTETPNILSYVACLSTFTRVAAYHDALPARVNDLGSLYKEVNEFAGGDYLLALYRGRDLPRRNRLSIAARLHRYTGIPKDYFINHSLAIARNDFRRTLLASRRLLLSEHDGRYIGSDRGSDPFIAHFQPAFDTQAQSEIDKLPKPHSSARYKHYTPEIAKLWKFGSSTGERPTVRYIQDSMLLRPGLKLMFVSGNYDLGTSVGLADYVMRHSVIDSSRTTIRDYNAGHMMYADPGCAAQLAADLRKFVS